MTIGRSKENENVEVRERNSLSTTSCQEECIAEKRMKVVASLRVECGSNSCKFRMYTYIIRI